jgi:hypothetical protein
MRVKVDEDLPQASVQMLRDRGYKVVSVVEQGMGGCKFLEATVAGQAAFVDSGGQDLTDMARFRGVEIVTPCQFRIGDTRDVLEDRDPHGFGLDPDVGHARFQDELANVVRGQRRALGGTGNRGPCLSRQADCLLLCQDRQD